jgi:PhnB protein
MNDSSPTIATARLTTMMSVRRGRDAVDFYTRAFGASVLSRFDAPDGTLVAQLALGQSEFWVSDEAPEYRNFSPETLGGGSMHLVILVDDPDAVYDCAIAAGATVECRVHDEPYGWRIGKLRDPFGHAWEIGKPLG